MKNLHRKQTLSGLLSLYIALLALPAYASTPPAVSPIDTTVSSNLSLDDVVVTGSRTIRLLKDVPTPIRIVKAKEIAQIAPSNFIDLLQYIMPGIEFRKHGPRDEINAQGFDLKSMLFLIDGELISTGTSAGIDFERINPDDIERIEVLRGASSALYGSNAIGGVINIITRTGRKPLELNASARIDSRLGQKYDLMATARWNSIASKTGLQYRREIGYKLSDALDNEQNIAGNDSWQLSQRFDLKASEALSFRVSGLANLRSQHWNDKIDFLYRSYDIHSSAQWQLNERSSLDLSYHYSNYVRDTCLVKTENQEKRRIFSEKLHHLRTQYNLDLNEKHLINLGAEYTYDAVEADRLSSPDSPGGKSNRSAVLYGQYVFHIDRDFSLSYGGRFDNHSGFGNFYTSRLSAMHRLGRCTQRLSYSEGYRAPSLQEQYFFFNHQPFYILGNPDLKPEKSRMISLSSESRWDKLSVMGNIFYNRIRSRIELEKQGINYAYINVPGSMGIFGIEAQSSVLLPYGFELRAAYTYTHDRRTIEDKAGTKMSTSNTRPHAATATLSYRYKFADRKWDLAANFSARYLSQLKAASYNADQLLEARSYPSYLMCRLSSEMRFQQRYTLLLGIENLFDYRAKSIAFNSPISPGRSYFGMIRIAI